MKQFYETGYSLQKLQEDDQLNALLRGNVGTIRTRRAQVFSHKEAHNMIVKVTPKAKIFN